MSTPEKMMPVAPQGPDEQNEPSDEKRGRLKRWEEELKGYLKDIPHKDNVIHIIVEEAEQIGKEIRSIGEEMRQNGEGGEGGWKHKKELQDSLNKKYDELRAVIDRVKARAGEGADERAIDEQRKSIRLSPPFGTRNRSR